MTARGIDHLVLCVHDLEAAQQAYRSFGFTTTPKAVHPFGTANSLIQLQNNFLELLIVDDAGKVPPMARGKYSFAAAAQSYLTVRQGMSALVFESGDARADHDEFVGKGLETYDPVDFSRLATLPDGSEAEVSCSLAFLTERQRPGTTFFGGQQHAPEHFWKPMYQRHDNGAVDVVEVVMFAPKPHALSDFFGKLHGTENVAKAEGRLSVDTGRGVISVLDPTLSAERLDVPASFNIVETPHFAGFRVAVADLAAVEDGLTKNGVPFRPADGMLQIGPADALGVFIEFAEAPAPAD